MKKLVGFLKNKKQSAVRASCQGVAVASLMAITASSHAALDPALVTMIGDIIANIALAFTACIGVFTAIRGPAATIKVVKSFLGRMGA